jgi:hypothetical protein
MGDRGKPRLEGGREASSFFEKKDGPFASEPEQEKASGRKARVFFL